MTTTNRVITPSFDKKGNPSFTSITSPPDDSCAVCYMVSDRIIPVIFVPGVMGSNLASTSKGGKNQEVWLLNDTGTAARWISKREEERKEKLNPQATKVFNGGKIPQGTLQTPDELKRRGWGEVGAISYAEFLVWVENTLNDYHAAKSGERMQLIGRMLEGAEGMTPLTKDEVGLSYRYRFPVHAVGYNWLESNVKSAKRLKAKIDEFIKHYTDNKLKCEKVILVTHSMGGLVARHCSEVLGAKEKILGIVHGVMPAIGAPAVYRRMKAGTENPTSDIAGWGASKTLGENAAEMTAVLSGAPGPLQLLPGVEYGMNWLSIKDRKSTVVTLPKSDPYSEIYAVRGKWWSLCDDQLINPLDKKKQSIEQDWMAFEEIIREDVKNFHQKIAGKYHLHTYAFYGADDKIKAYGNVNWRRAVWGPEHANARMPKDVLNAPFMRTGGTGTATFKGTPSEGVSVVPGVKMPATGVYADPSQWVYMTINEPDEAGDGTVPERSGKAPKPYVKALFRLQRIGHEPAYKNENRHAQLAALYGIVKIAQEIKHTSLHYAE